MREVIVVVLGVLGMEMIFAAVRSEWPHSYFQAGNGFQRRISAHPWSYCLFRFGPVFVVCLFAGAVLAKDDHPFWWAILGIAAMHVLYRIGRAAFGATREAWPEIPWVSLIAYLGVTAGCFVAAVAAGFLTQRAAPYVPAGDDLVVAAWTGVFAAIGGAWLLAATRRGSDDGDSQQRAFHASKEALGNDLWDRAARTAMDVHADARLVQAVLLVENLQRPRWLRRLERLAGRLPRSGSFGPLQVQQVPPSLDDGDALDAAIHRRFRGQRCIDPYGNIDSAWLDLFLAAYNPNKTWQQDVRDAYFWLETRDSAALAATDHRADDGLPVLEIEQFDDSPSVRLGGTLGPGLCYFVVEQLGDDGRVLDAQVVHAGLIDRRQSWSLALERLIETTTLVLQVGFIDGRGLEGGDLEDAEAFGAFLGTALGNGGETETAPADGQLSPELEWRGPPEAFREATLSLPCLPLPQEMSK